MLAQLFPLHVAAKTKLYLDTAVLVAAVVLFEPGVALLLMGAGTALAHVARREPWDQTLFNTAQVVLLAAAGSALLTATGWRGDQSTLDHPQWMLFVVAISVLMMLSSDLIVSTMVALQLGEPLPAVLVAGGGPERSGRVVVAPRASGAGDPGGWSVGCPYLDGRSPVAPGCQRASGPVITTFVSIVMRKRGSSIRPTTTR